MATMPNVVGLGWQQATVYLIQAGVVPDNGLLPTGSYVTLGYFDAWPIKIIWTMGGVAGVVTAQNPAPGASILAPAGVNVSAKYVPPITLTVNQFPMGLADRYSAGGYA